MTNEGHLLVSDFVPAHRALIAVVTIYCRRSLLSILATWEGNDLLFLHVAQIPTTSNGDHPSDEPHSELNDVSFRFANTLIRCAIWRTA